VNYNNIDTTIFIEFNKNMSNTKILQALLDGQSEIKDEIKEVKEDLKKTDNKLTKRIDNLGLQLAELADDAPTREEHEKLEGRMENLEKQVVSA
jgi:uncharacterized phage infection (PIP) family protein YhgE